MKILIVEDDLEISKLLADFLQGNGYVQLQVLFSFFLPDSYKNAVFPLHSKPAAASSPPAAGKSHRLPPLRHIT